MEENLKEVPYDLYSPTCLYQNNAEHEEPCHDCLNEPIRYFSHKPYRWKGKESYEDYVAPELKR